MFGPTRWSTIGADRTGGGSCTAVLGSWRGVTVPGDPEMAPGRVGLPTGTVTFMLTDIAGATERWDVDPRAMHVAVGRHYELLDRIVERHGGMRPVEQGEGDSTVSVFVDPGGAVLAASEVQRAFAAEPWAVEPPLAVRIAVHTGEGRLRDAGNYAGPAIIRAARLRELAHGGQVVLSGTTRALVDSALPDGVSLVSMGRHRLKGLHGDEDVWCLVSLDDDVSPRTLRSSDAVPNNLPTHVTAFVGRSAEADAVVDLLSLARLTTVVGVGGCGKTRLALHVARRLLHDYGDGVFFVDLATAADGDVVGDAVIGALGLPPLPGRTPTEIACWHLAGRRGLLILDNCEHVADTVREVVTSVLDAAPDVAVLATSRTPIGAPGEELLRLSPLETPPAAEDLPVAELLAYDSVRLVLDRVRRVRPSFRLTASNRGAVAAICDRLDGIPLALELAAGRAAIMDVTEIADALGERFRLLTAARADAPRHHATLRASLEWSHDLLGERDRELFARLAVFDGTFDLAAVERVGVGAGGDRFEVLDALARLVDASLVEVVEHDAGLRYRLLETVRQYATERLHDAGRFDEAAHVHLQHFLEVATGSEEAATHASAQALDRLEVDSANLRQAVAWAVAQGHTPEALRLIAAVMPFWTQRGHFADAERWPAAALAAASDHDELRARVTWALAYVSLYTGNRAAGIEHALTALAIAEEAGTPAALARPLHMVGSIQMIPDPVGCREPLQRSVGAAREAGDDWCMADAMQMLAYSHVLLDEHDDAARWFGEALPIVEARDNRYLLAWHLFGTGWAEVVHGELRGAERSLRQSMAASDTVGAPLTGGLARGLLALVAAVRGEDEWRALLEQCRRAAPDNGEALTSLWATFQESAIAVARGLPDAVPTATRALEQLTASGWAAIRARSQLVLAAALLNGGDVGGAAEQLAEARAHADVLPNPFVAASIEHVAGLLARQRGDLRTAAGHQHDALERAKRAGYRLLAVDCLDALAGISVAAGRHREAARLAGAASAARVRIGNAAALHGPVVLADREALRDGDDTAGAWEEGSELVLDEAIRYAMRSRGRRRRPAAGWHSLTPAEVDVVRLVASGLTNRQVGEQLLMSLSTVKTHLSSAFAKLGVAGRAELAALVTRMAADEAP